MLRIRPARSDDYPAFTQLFPELAIPDPVPTDDEWAKRCPTTLVAEVEGGVVGYLFHEFVERLLYVRHVVTDPARRRAGVGKALMAAARDVGVRAGADRWCLNVKDDNVAAIRLYESNGMRIASPSRVLRLGWSLPAAVLGARPRVSVLQPDEDAQVEAALSLLPGQMARLRSQGRVLLLARGDAGRPVGLAAFDPPFPGAYPFRANSEGVAAALVEAMAPHRVPHAGGDGDWRAHSVQVVLEDQEAVADGLVLLGAAPVFRILHMVGALG